MPWRNILLGLLTLVAGTTAIFWQDIREVRALREYAAIFEPDVIDENFRSFYKKYPSIGIKRAGPVYELPVSLRGDALPETYIYQDQEENLQQFLLDTQTSGLLVMHGDDVVYENYWRGDTAEDHHIVMSISKSMASMLVGVAVADGLIDVGDQVTKYVPQLIGSAYDGVTIKNLLEMASGVRWSEDYGRLDSDLVQSIVAMLLGSLDDYALTLEREREPGTYNHYASMDTHILGMVLRGATGMPYQQYFEEKLWSRLGAESDVKMLVDAVGEPLVYGGVNIRLRDMARFGKLYLNEGRNFAGEQLVPASWVKASTTPDAPMLMPMADNPQSSSGFGYKYQWWIPFTPDGDDFAAIGIYGQFVYVNPKRNVVIAKTSSYLDYTKDGGWMNHETLVAMQAIAQHLTPDSFAPQ